MARAFRRTVERFRFAPYLILSAVLFVIGVSMFLFDEVIARALPDSWWFAVPFAALVLGLGFLYDHLSKNQRRK